MKDYQKAIEALSDLLALIGENPNSLHAIAVCQRRLGNDDAALGFAERGLAADPMHLGCLEVLTEIHAARGDLEAAAGFARRALDCVASNRIHAAAVKAAGHRLFALLRPRTHAGSGQMPSPEWISWASRLIEDRRGAGNR